MDNQIVTVVHAGFEVSGTAAYLAERGVPVQQIAEQALTQARQAALERIRQQHAQALQQLSGDATGEERDTWPVQLQAALAYTAGTASDSQHAMIAEMLVKDETPPIWAAKVLAKNAAMQQLIGVAQGIKRRAEKAIEVAADSTAIDTALALAKEEAMAAMRQFTQ